MPKLHKFFRGRHCRQTFSRRASLGPELTIRDLKPGHPAHVVGFSATLPPEQRALLQAYGLVPGYPIRVVQQSPVSVVQVEHTEIALEEVLAGEVYISEDSLS